MYGAYLRKSRADLELEKNSGIDTLKRHRDIIKRTAQSMNINIDVWWEEIVSGETIEARPEIQKMLLEVEQGHFKAILVVDVDRLARGDTADQSRISKAFAFSSTKIITQTKIYDPENEADEEYFEFNLFMSRREYKIINRRLNRGRISSVNEGKFVGSVCPYGYSKEKIKGQKGYKLIIDDEEAKIVRIIFDLACQGTGASNIANHLNSIGSIPRKTEVWVSASIRSIIQNPVYYGMIKWNHRKTEKKMINGIVYKTRPKHKDYILAKGLHQPIVDEEVWKMANEKTKIREGKSVKKSLTIQNPLAGLVTCGFCGRIMQRRPYSSKYPAGLICSLPHCKNCSSHLYIVENSIIDGLKAYLKEYEEIVINYKDDDNPVAFNNTNKEIIEKDLAKTEKQLNKAYDLLEQGVYDNDTFFNRSKQLRDKVSQLKEELKKYSVESPKKKIEKIRNIIPSLEKVVQTYSSLLSPEEKNELLKQVINKIIYLKTEKGRGHEDDFTLKIEIKL